MYQTMTINQFFDILVCLTQEKRYDRHTMLSHEVAKHKLDIKHFYSIPDKDPKVSFCKSQIEMLKWFLETGKETVLCLEDDVKFVNLDIFQQVTQQLPKDWNILYLGANVRPYPEFIEPSYFSENLRVLKSAFCTHAVAYKRELVQEIVDTYEYIEGEMFDSWLDRVILKKHTAYITYPMLAHQKPVNSTLWNRFVDYTDIWISGDDYLKQIK